MPNVIEIVVRSRADTASGFEEAKRSARSSGTQVGDEFSKGVEDTIEDAIPPAVRDTLGKTKEPARQSGSDTGAAFTQALSGALSAKVDAISSGSGALAGTTFSAKFGEAAKKSMTSSSLMAALGSGATEELAKTQGEQAGLDFTEAFGGRVRERAQPDIEQPLEDAGRSGGAKAGAAASTSLSPLLVGAFAAAATIGPTAILAGVATAVTGVAALIARSNAQVAMDYQNLGSTVSSTLTSAVTPVMGDIDAAVLVLQQGVTQLGPELTQLFAAVGPDATALASGLVQLAQGALPGIVSGMKAVQPVMQDVAADFGKIGQGIGGLFAGLGGGIGGATTAFDALSKSLSQILPDIGQIVGDLSNGLGPALRDVLTVATPVANGLARIVAAFPPQAIEAAADAVTALFLAFKVGTIAKVVGEGTTFVQFLKGETAAAGEAATATSALGTAAEAAAGPLGLLAVTAVGLGTGGMGTMSYQASQASASVQQLTKTLTDAANGSQAASQQLTQLLGSTVALSVDTGAPSQDMKDLDAALAGMVASGHAGQAAKDLDLLKAAMDKGGMSVSSLTDRLPEYNAAVSGAAQKQQAATTTTDTFTAALQAQSKTLATNAQSSAQATLAALGASDGQNGLTQRLYGILSAYSDATTGANAYATALNAMNGTAANVDDAQNNLAQAMLNAKTSFAQNSYSLDLNTQAGINNREALSAAAKDIIAMGVAQYQTNGNMTDANNLIKQQVDAYVKSTGATGKAKDAIENYLLSIAKIPPDVSTTVTATADTSPAYKGIKDLLNYINSSGATVHVYETDTGVHNTGMSAYAKAVGGPVGAAAFGGAHGSFTWVGEEGPELLPLPFGTQVIPHSNVSAMAASGQLGGGSGPSGPLQIELVSNGFEDMWIRALRHAIRVRGGNVQKVLGVN